MIQWLYLRSVHNNYWTLCCADASGVQVASTFDGDGVWQWRDTDNIWRSYDKMINKEIEAACKKKTGLSCLIERDGKQ